VYSAPEPNPSDAKWYAAAAVGAALLGALLLAPMLLYPFGRDQGAFAAVADVIARGGAPYRDAWEIKPPGIYYLFYAAFAVFGRSMLAARLLDALCTLAAAAVLALVGRQLVGKWAALGGAVVFLALYALGFDYWTATQCESFAALPLALAALSLLAAERRGSPVLALLCGALIGVAVVLKFTLGGFLLLPLAAALGGRQEPARRRILRSACYLVGCAAVLAAAAALTWATGALRDMLYILFDWNLQYAGLRPKAPLAATTLRETARFLFGGPRLFPKLAAALALLGAADILRDPGSTRGRWLSPAWAAVMLLSVWAQLKFHPYHWLPMLPPMGLLAGHGIALLHRLTSPSEGPHRGRALTAILLLLAGTLLASGYAAHFRGPLAYATGRMSQLSYFRRFGSYGEGDFSFVADAQVASYLRGATDPGDPIFIWGFEPLVYFLADRPPASRFITLQPLVSPWSPPQWQDQLIADLERERARCILVLHNDVFPWVTGSTLDSAGQLARYPALERLLATDYQLDRRIEHFDVYVRARPQSDR
jgi:4-amino-4-deoxy-L-arabinose transferase-like glycosyltransferase